MKDIDLDLLRCFAIVAETRNFTLAGERMGRSQSAVSIRIRKLEEQLDCRLLVRNNQEVRLTDRGKTLLPKAIALLESGEHLLAEMRGPAISGRLRIGFSISSGLIRLSIRPAPLPRRRNSPCACRKLNRS